MGVTRIIAVVFLCALGRFLGSDSTRDGVMNALCYGFPQHVKGKSKMRFKSNSKSQFYIFFLPNVVVNTPASYSGSPRFKSRPRDQLS